MSYRIIMFKTAEAATSAALEAVRDGLRVGLCEATWGGQRPAGIAAAVDWDHHEGRENEDAPCVRRLQIGEKPAAYGVASHIDLDAALGLAAMLGVELQDSDLAVQAARYAAAVDVDVRGPHRLPEIKAELWAMNDAAARVIETMWACAPRTPLWAEGQTSMDVTALVEEWFSIWRRAIAGDAALEAKRACWAKANESLEAESFEDLADVGHAVVIRRAPEKGGRPAFVNHLYRHDGVLYKAVVSWQGCAPFATTVSLCDAIDGVDCAQLAKEVWGPTSGGKAVIAGCDRGGWGSAAKAEEMALAMARRLGARLK
jgi:hypothetical protein